MARHVAGIDLGGTKIQGVVIGAGTAELLDVRAVLVGGGLADALGGELTQRIELAAAPHLLAEEPPLEIRLTELGDLAGSVGAALLVHEAPPSVRGTRQ